MESPDITEDYYNTLEVNQNATLELITSSYRRLASDVRPRNGGYTQAYQPVREHSLPAELTPLEESRTDTQMLHTARPSLRNPKRREQMSRVRPHLSPHQTQPNKRTSTASIPRPGTSTQSQKLLKRVGRSPQKPPTRRSSIDASTRRSPQNGRKSRNRNRTNQEIQGDGGSGSHRPWRHSSGPRISLLLRRRMAQDRRWCTVPPMPWCLHVPAFVSGLRGQHMQEVSEGVSLAFPSQQGKDGENCFSKTQRGLGLRSSRLDVRVTGNVLGGNGSKRNWIEWHLNGGQ